METHPSDLIQAITRTLPDEETKLAARSFLSYLNPSSGPDTEKTLQRLDTVDRRNRWPAPWAFLSAMLAIISVWVLWDSWRLVRDYESAIYAISSPPFADLLYANPSPTEETVARNLSKEDALLLFGDLSRTSKAERKKALWDSAPENPGYFADYANEYLSENKSLPPDFLDTARRIDPDNAWFTYVAAGVKAKDAVKSKTSPLPRGRQPSPPPSPEWEILDHANFTDALALLREARKQPECKSYAAHLHRQRMAVLLPEKSLPERLFVLVYAVTQSSGGEASMRELAGIMACEAWRAGQAGDEAAFREILHDARDFLKKRSKQEAGALLPELITRIVLMAFVSNASPVADQFGMEPEASRLRDLLAQVNDAKSRQQEKRETEARRMVYNQGSDLIRILGDGRSEYASSPPPPLPGEFVPGRLSEHELRHWIHAHLAWAALVILCGISALYRFRAPAMLRMLSWKLKFLLHPSDWIIIFTLGVLLPLSGFAFVTRTANFSGRDRSLAMNEIQLPIFKEFFELPTYQWVGTVLLIALLSVAATRWRIHKRTASISGGGRPLSFLVTGAAICVAIFIPLFGWAVSTDSQIALGIAWTFAALATWQLFWVLVRSLFATSLREILRIATISRCLVPIFTSAALCVVATAPFSKASAQAWAEKDTLVRVDRDVPASTPLERRVCLQLRKELNEWVGMFP